MGKEVLCGLQSRQPPMIFALWHPECHTATQPHSPEAHSLTVASGETLNQTVQLNPSWVPDPQKLL